MNKEYLLNLASEAGISNPSLIDLGYIEKIVGLALSKQNSNSVEFDGIKTTWQPIATAPKDNKRPLYLADIDDECRPINVFSVWASCEWESDPDIQGWYDQFGMETLEPTHWAYHDEPIPKVPNGWKLVPVEPTEDMQDAYARVEWTQDARHIWQEMLNAAPQPPKGEV